MFTLHEQDSKTTLGFMLNISSVRSVDKVLSRSVIGFDRVAVELLASEVGGVSSERRPLQQ